MDVPMKPDRWMKEMVEKGDMINPFEAEWEGRASLEISNTRPLPAKICADEGIARVIFFGSDGPRRISYADRGGRYRRQTGITLPWV